MVKNTIYAAMFLFCFAVAGLVAVAGGCGGGRTGRPGRMPPEPTVCSMPTAPDSEPPPHILDESATSIGRLEAPASVTATLFHANGGIEGQRTVTLVPGTWVMPAGVFREPEKTDRGADDE